MNNSNKLSDDVKKHNGTAWAKAWLEESENELKHTSNENTIKYTCKHKINKKYLLTGYYFKCELCGMEFD